VAIQAVSGGAQLLLKAASQNGVPDFSVLSIPVAQVNSLPAGKRKGVPMSGLGRSALHVSSYDDTHNPSYLVV
jgi:hypothetical protein